MSAERQRVLATNRKAHHDYLIQEVYEAGIALTGSEVKAIRAGRANLRDGFAKVEGGQVWLWNVHVGAYEPASRFGHAPRRPRRLLLHREEIRRLTGKVEERGYTLVPLRLYLRGHRIKVELGLGRGRKLYDKREALAEREAQRETERALHGRGGKIE